jgi:hypothetical protein
MSGLEIQQLTGGPVRFSAAEMSGAIRRGKADKILYTKYEHILVNGSCGLERMGGK